MRKYLVVVGLLLSVFAKAEVLLFTPKQLADLKATGRPIIVPNYLPDGFQVKKVTVDRNHPEVPSYSIWFAGPGNACFAIEMGTEVGDMIVEAKPTSTVHNPILGATDFWNTREYLGTDWFPPYQKTAYRIRGFDSCKRVRASEFIKVAKSLDAYK